MSSFVLVFICLFNAGHVTHAQTLFQTGHCPESSQCQNADNSAGTSKDSVKLLQHRVEVGKDMEDEPLVDEYMADKHLKDVLPEDRHMEDDTSESRGDNIMNMAQLHEGESQADEEKDDVDENDSHADDFVEEDAKKNAVSADSDLGLHFLRIQKTGGTTFGKRIMPELCMGSCKGVHHLDWNGVHAGNWNGPILTILRDPVERTLSEFFFLRTDKGKIISRQIQWNFHNSTWLSYVQNYHNIDKALEVYLGGYPRNPSINRQALYLLGFYEPTQAGNLYDWERDHDSLVQQAKAHLDKITVFGITDCFQKSMEVIGKELGWSPERMMLIAEQYARKQDKQEAASHLKFRKPLTNMLDNAGGTPESQLWRDLVSPAIVQAIEKQNAVDMELLSYAKNRFQERFGAACWTGT